MTNPLMQIRASAKEKAHALLNKVSGEGRALTPAEERQYNTYKEDIEDANKALDRQLSAMNNGVLPHVQASSNMKSSGMNSNLRAAYNAASTPEREQFDMFAGFLRGEITAAATLTPGGDGSVLIPTFVVPAMERDYMALAAVQSVARVWATESGGPAVFPVLSDSESAEILAADALTGLDDTVSGDSAVTALTGPTLHAYKFSSKPTLIARELKVDSDIDLVAEILNAQLSRVIRWENKKYTIGTGTNEPRGFMVDATAFNFPLSGSGSHTTLTTDDVLNLVYDVPALYRTNGTFMASDVTVKWLRLLKDDVGRPLWQDEKVAKGTPATLFGYPIVVNNEMDSVDASGHVTAATSPLAFGDFSKHVIRFAENGAPYVYRWPIPARDGVACMLLRRSDSRLIIPGAIHKLLGVA